MKRMQMTTIPLTAVLMLLLCSQSVSMAMDGIEVKHLAKQDYCPDQILNSAFLFRTVPVRSKIECLGQCRADNSCVSIVYKKTERLCHFGNASANDTCSNMVTPAPGVSFYQKPPLCLRNMELDLNGLCVCKQGFRGTPCARYMHDCNDIKLYGNWTTDGVYSISPLGPDQSFLVSCRYITTTRTIFMDHRSSKVYFNRTYLEYVNGFGDVSSNDFWIGLKNLYALTANRGYELRINIKDKDNNNLIQAYSEFQVTNESTGFRLRFNQSINNGADDCFMPLYDAPFSSYDHDMDGQPSVNCGQKRKGGFWYSGTACSTCNPFGILYQPANGLRLGTDDEGFWTSALGNLAMFKVQMYIIDAPE